MFVLAATPAAAQQAVVISPYIEAGQILSADLTNDDVLTYTTLSAGVDASIQTRRVEVQLNYNYQHRFSWDDDIGDDDVHNGLARAAVRVANGVSIEGGAIATRARSDIRGDAGPVFGAGVDNVSQLYSLYVGPTVATTSGPFSLNAAYRLGYTKVETPGFRSVGDDFQPLDLYDDATSQLLFGSVGTRAGTIAPFGITLSGAWEREEASQLDQYYDGKYARIDLVQPVSRTLAVVGGAGYEDIEIGQRDPLFDADGFPVTDRNGRFVTDPDSPVRLAYDLDGFIWDAGVVWRPSIRTMLEARVGERYGSTIYTGSLSWAVRSNASLQVGVYDGIQSFGRQLNDSLAALPTNFVSPSDPFGGQYNGCVTGGSNGATGSCLAPVFQSIATANYRARGVDAIYAVTSGNLRYGLGAGYASRRFYAPDRGQGFSIDGVIDESYYAQAFGQTTLDPQSTLAGNVYVNYFDSGLGAAPDVWGAGATGSYFRSFGRINAGLSGGLYTFEQEGLNNQTYLQALAALGYRF
nr:hypothetical protein [Sphingomonas japonica]